MHEEAVFHELLQDLNLPLDLVEVTFETNLKNGLDADEATERLTIYGLNVPAEKAKRMAEWRHFVTHLFGTHNSQLWFGAMLCFIVHLTDNYLTKNDLEVKPDNLYIGISLLAFVFALGLFSFYMDAKCDFYRESCRDFLSNYSVVIRDGVPQEIADSHLVVGDLLIFRTGEQIPADVKLLECWAIRLSDEMLSDCQRTYYRQLYGNVDSQRLYQPGELLLNSTFILGGHGRGIVTRTQKSYLSKCTHLNQAGEKHETKGVKMSKQPVGSLTAELNTFLSQLMVIAIIVGIIFAIWSLWNGFSLLRAGMLFIAFYIGIITQAVMPTLNVAKAQIAKQLASQNCYIQNIEALETLGTITAICTNKTGVITQNKMIISQIWIDNTLMQSYSFMRHYKGTQLKEPFDAFVRVCSLSTFALFGRDEEEESISPFKRNAIGKPSEVALLRYMEAFIGESIETYQGRHHKCMEMSFNYTTRCSFKMYQLKGDPNRLLVCLKGEPETLIAGCSTILTSRGLDRFGSTRKETLLGLCKERGKKKYRMIAIAQAFVDVSFLANHPSDLLAFNDALRRKQVEMTFLGVLVLENPVRLSVPEAIFKCRRAGIKVLMTTADHPQTALSIAQTVGIVLSRWSANDTLVDMEEQEPNDGTRTQLLISSRNLYTSKELEAMSDSQLKSIISSDADLVFGRISPSDKLRIIECCRSVGWIVAVTGIGTSDLPVYERAHVKLSLGQYGADISKANSDVILLDDNFSTVVNGIEEGRTLFQNMKKSLCYTLSSKPVEIFPFILAFSLSMPKMASSITIMAIDLIADNFAPIAIGYETGEAHIMRELPRFIRDESVINFDAIMISLFFYGVIQFLCGIFAYFVVMAQMGFFPTSLVFIAHKWYSPAVNDYEDDYGQEWTYQKRAELEFTCHTIYFISVVLCRIAVLYSCRTRRDSIVGQFFSNSMINFSVFFLLFSCAFLSYYPIFQVLVQMYPVKLLWWLIPLPFFVLICVIEELRKYIIRHYPNSIVAQVTHY